LLFLFLQNFSIRALEVVIGIFLFVISACFVVEMFLVDIDLVHMAMGFIPFDGFISQTDKSGYTVAAISLVGAVVMPHNLYLHSALVQSRKVGRDKKSVTEAMIYNLLECSMALGVSFLINLAIITGTFLCCRHLIPSPSTPLPHHHTPQPSLLVEPGLTEG
jgi:manganese transport protein